VDSDSQRIQRCRSYENLRYLTTLHRVPATPEFDQAAQFSSKKAREYGLADAHSEQFLSTHETYGLMRSYLGWSVAARPCGKSAKHLLLGDWRPEPNSPADYSHSADVTAALVDVGNGAREDDYRDKDVRARSSWPIGVLARVRHSR